MRRRRGNDCIGKKKRARGAECGGEAEVFYTSRGPTKFVIKKKKSKKTARTRRYNRTNIPFVSAVLTAESSRVYMLVKN